MTQIKIENTKTITIEHRWCLLHLTDYWNYRWRMTIQVIYDCSYTYYFDCMWTDVLNFFVECSTDYLFGKLKNYNKIKTNHKKLIESIIEPLQFKCKQDDTN